MLTSSWYVYFSTLNEEIVILSDEVRHFDENIKQPINWKPLNILKQIPNYIPEIILPRNVLLQILLCLFNKLHLQS